MKCYACEKTVRPSTGIVIENLSDGERLVMHRPCVLKIANLLPVDEAIQLHHQLGVQAIFRDGDYATRQRQAAAAASRAQAQRVETMQEPVVEQHPLGWVPES